MRRALAALLALALAASTAAAAAPSRPASIALPPLDGPLRIMPLGDSITAGHGSANSAGYRWPLGAYLVNTGQLTATYVGSRVDPRGIPHEGWSGARLDQLAAYIDGWQAAAAPNVVLLHAGINDARQGASAETMLARMSVLLDRILANNAGVRVVVGDLIPAHGPAYDASSLAVQRFNRGVGALVAGKGPRVSLARMSRISNGLLADGLHPGEGGYAQMAWLWWRCMAPLLRADGVTGYGQDPMPVAFPDTVLCQHAA